MVVGGRLLASGLSDARVHVLPDVGHEPFVEEPDATFGLLRPFLAAAGGSGAVDPG
jgi:pimeloyl-ACP methyl ester carboxylesterase